MAVRRKYCFIPCVTNYDRLVEMWLGIICTCLPILYTFFRTQVLAKTRPRRQGTLVAVRDPNSDQGLDHTPEDSGYYTGNSTAVGLEYIDVEGSHRRSSMEHSVRPAASDKNLLLTAERCDE